MQESTSDEYRCIILSAFVCVDVDDVVSNADGCFRVLQAMYAQARLVRLALAIHSTQLTEGGLLDQCRCHC